ncbi:hypothetical protein PIB30_088719 [Stylosanthes scabra]|uniref:Uncharacterized protein n=1 Tax=Stylosanthes scabra TaxID=79078 RepID=A0ABU6YRG2_9FABA|nr:hypothetical protein [Stylosanthes scabra]
MERTTVVMDAVVAGNSISVAGVAKERERSRQRGRIEERETRWEEEEGFAATATPKGNNDKQILKFDPEIERTLRKLRKQSKQTHEISSEEVFEEVFDNMAAEGTQVKTLGEYSVPTTASCGSSIVRPTVDANNFELKPSLIQLVQQE